MKSKKCLFRLICGSIFSLLLIIAGTSHIGYASNINIPQGTIIKLNTADLKNIEDLSNSGTVILTSGCLTVLGDWRCDGTFTAGSGTVIFEDNTRTSTISGSTTFYNLTCITPGKDIVLAANLTQTVTNQITFDGQAIGTEITLTSSSPGTRWFIDNQGGYQTVNFVDVKDSNVSGESIVNEDYVDSGNNDDSESSPHWIFGGLAITNVCTPPSGTVDDKCFTTDTVPYEVTATSPDQANIQYRFKLDDRTVQDYSTDNDVDFTPQAGEIGPCTMLVTAQDSRDAYDETSFDICIYHEPIEP